MTKIKTTHVGSLPRSNELSDLLFKKDKKEKIDIDNFDAVVKNESACTACLDCVQACPEGAITVEE